MIVEEKIAVLDFLDFLDFLEFKALRAQKNYTDHVSYLPKGYLWTKGEKKRFSDLCRKIQIKVLYKITNDYGPIITKRYFCWKKPLTTIKKENFKRFQPRSATRNSNVHKCAGVLHICLLKIRRSIQDNTRHLGPTMTFASSFYSNNLQI